MDPSGDDAADFQRGPAANTGGRTVAHHLRVQSTTSSISGINRDRDHYHRGGGGGGHHSDRGGKHGRSPRKDKYHGGGGKDSGSSSASAGAAAMPQQPRILLKPAAAAAAAAATPATETPTTAALATATSTLMPPPPPRAPSSSSSSESKTVRIARSSSPSTSLSQQSTTSSSSTSASSSSVPSRSSMRSSPSTSRAHSPSASSSSSSAAAKAPSSTSSNEDKKNTAASTTMAMSDQTANTDTTSDPSTAVKLMNNRLRFIPDALDKLLRDQHDYSVIGIIGGDGVGKSFIMSSLCSSSSVSHQRIPLDDPGSAIFTVGDDDNIITCSHCTAGVDVYITNERLIYIDTQPLLSSSVLQSMIRDDIPLPQSQTVENLFHIQSIQLAVWILSVCQVVLIAHDSPAPNIPLWKLLRTAFMLRGTLEVPPFLRSPHLHSTLAAAAAAHLPSSSTSATAPASTPATATVATTTTATNTPPASARTLTTTSATTTTSSTPVAGDTFRVAQPPTTTTAESTSSATTTATTATAAARDTVDKKITDEPPSTTLTTVATPSVAPSSTSSSGNTGADVWSGTPDLVFVFNRLSDAHLRADIHTTIGHALNRFWNTSDFRKTGFICTGATTSVDCVNFYCLPDHDHNHRSNGYHLYHRGIRQLRERLLAMPKLPPATKMSEREWLKYSGMIWKEIGASQPIGDYKRMLATMMASPPTITATTATATTPGASSTKS